MLMPVYRLYYSQVIPASLESAWEFFSLPGNLDRITPEWLKFQIRFSCGDKMYPGMIVEYTIRAIAGIPMRWVTEITHVDKPYMFVDEQRLGPYRFWHHQHLFREAGQGTEVVDLVHYSLPWGNLARPVHYFLIRSRLEEIFAYRQRSLAKIWEQKY